MLAEWWTRFQFGAASRRNIYQSFVDYLSEGIPINDVVKQLSQSIMDANADSQKFLIRILRDIERKMSMGVEFSEAMSNWVPINEVMSIRAGMKSGDPVKGMMNTIDALDAASEMKGTIMLKLSYPGCLLIALVGLIFYFSVNVIPQIEDVLDPALWPSGAKKLHAMAYFTRNYWWIILSVVVGLSVWCSYALPRLTGPLRTRLDSIPPFSFYREFNGANLLIAVSSLMRSGVPFVDSLQELRRMSSPYVGAHITDTLKRMAEGKSLPIALDTGLLSKETMVSVYMMGKNSNFQTAIHTIGRISVRKGIEKISKISAILNLMSIISTAGYIAWVYLSFNAVMVELGRSASTGM